MGVRDDRIDRDAHENQKPVHDVNVVVVGHDLVQELDIEHGRQHANECVEVGILLCYKQRPAPQDGERHINGIDDRRDAEGYHPPLSGQRGVLAIFNPAIDQQQFFSCTFDAHGLDEAGVVKSSGEILTNRIFSHYGHMWDRSRRPWD